MQWRLALDIGTNSLGWWAYEITKDGNKESKGGGVCLFPDGRESSTKIKVGDSLAVKRRQSRSIRRNREHGDLRLAKLVKKLVETKLLPEDQSQRKHLFQTVPTDPDKWNPYRLRAAAAQRKLEPYELGRALFHLGLRRGYKSNRKIASDDEGGKLKSRMSGLGEKLAEQKQTLGQYLWTRLQDERQKPATGSLDKKPKPVRFAGGNPDFANRDMYAKEFQKIRSVQEKFHQLAEQDWKDLGIYILEQRPLKHVERGCCKIYPDEPRHWKGTPAGHAFRIYQEVNNLTYTDAKFATHNLTKEQHDAVLDKLMSMQELTFKAMRKLKDRNGNLLFPYACTFNLEGEKREALKGHSIAAAFNKKGSELKRVWKDYAEDDGRLDAIFEILFEAENDEKAKQTLEDNFPDLNEQEIKALIAISLNRATGSLSLKAMRERIPIMRDQRRNYPETGEEQPFKYKSLPYYGKAIPKSMLGANSAISAEENPEKHYGRINNPTVHVTLNQLRKLVNVLVKHFGCAPVKIHVEMTRDLKLPKKKREEINKKQAENQKNNEIIRSCLQEEFKIENPSPNDIKKWKLWEELGGTNGCARQCPFTGKIISAAQLFNGEVEIEHILPFSRTLDDSMANLTLAFHSANRHKGNRTPHEAFSKKPEWEKIAERASKLPKNKAWRFGEKAMDRYGEENDGFIARQLTDTAYIAKVTARYLRSLEGVEHVVCSPGRLTAMVRGKWKLNEFLSPDNRKNRDDHRHHAVDAAVIGLIDRSLLQEISKLSKRGAKSFNKELPELDPGLKEKIRKQVQDILPFYKPDHGLEGQMFKETAYGFIFEEKNLVDLTEEEVKQQLYDTGISKDLLRLFAGKKCTEKTRKAILPAYAKTHGIGKVKIIKGLVTRKALISLTEKEINQIRDARIREELKAHIMSNPGIKHEKILASFGEKHGIKRVRIKVENQTVRPVPSAPYKGYALDSYICCDIWAIPGKKGKKPTYKGVFWPYNEVGKDSQGKACIDKNRKKPHPAARYITRVFKNDMIKVGPPQKKYPTEGFRTKDGDQIFRIAGFSTTNNKLDVQNPCAANEGGKQTAITTLAATKGICRLHMRPDGHIFNKHDK